MECLRDEARALESVVWEDSVSGRVVLVRFSWFNW